MKGRDGLPFTRLTNWVAYEALQGNIVSHTIAVLDRFGLRPFHEPTDTAVRSISSADDEAPSLAVSAASAHLR